VKVFRVRRSGPLRGSVRVPGDKSIGHRALIFAALAEGDSRIRGLSGGLDNVSTADAFRAMGVAIEREGGESEARVKGVGLRGLRMARAAIDCGNSGTTMRMLAGLLAPQEFGTRLVGDASLTRRPMRRIVEPLRARGAHIAGSPGKTQDEIYPPISIAPQLPEEKLIGLEHELHVASAQVKSALLFSGLYARGLTALREPVLSRDHTERMMIALGVPVQTLGPMVVLDPSGWSGGWPGFDWEVPGDPSSAAFLLAAAHLVPKSEVQIENVCVNPTRTGFLDALRAMGAGTYVMPKGDAAGDEPVGDLLGERRPLTGGRTGGELLTRMIDEVPAFCAVAAMAKGRTEVRDAAELRVKESDRIATMCTVLRAFGVVCEELSDGMVIEGAKHLRGARVKSEGDHRIAMSAVLLGLVADGETVVEDVECVDTSFPGFASLLRGLGADIVEEEIQT
jgi:3-phosphoshikimate 1-carboxyvinyltransferase